MRKIPFRARPGKALLKKKALQLFKSLLIRRDWAILREDSEREKILRNKLNHLANFFPKICYCTREEIKKKLKI